MRDAQWDIHRQVPAVSVLTPPLKPLSTEHAFVLVRVLVRSISGLALLPSPPRISSSISESLILELIQVHWGGRRLVLARVLLGR